MARAVRSVSPKRLFPLGKALVRNGKERTFATLGLAWRGGQAYFRTAKPSTTVVQQQSLPPKTPKARRRARSSKHECDQSELQITTRSARLLTLVQSDSGLYQSFYQRSREWLVRGKVDGPFRCGEAFQLVFEGFDYRGGREQTTVVRKRGEP